MVKVDVLDLSFFGRGKVEEEGDGALEELVDCSGVLDVVKPSPTGDVDGFQPFDTKGIAGGMLYRDLYKMDVMLYCVRSVAYAEVIRIPRAKKVKPGGRRSPFS